MKLVMMIVMTVFIRYITILESPGNIDCNRCPIASMIADIPNETSNKNPKLTIMENDSRRFFMKLFHPEFGLGLTPQIILIESCISVKTLEAPTINSATPTMVAKILFPLMAAC